MSLLPRWREAPRRRSASPERVRADRNALTAAGARIGKRDGDALRRVVMPWQTRSFAYYDLLGEIKFAAQFYSRSLSKLRLFPAVLDDSGELVEDDDPTARAALERIQDPAGGRSGLLSQYGRLMFLVGEAYLLTSLDPDTGVEQWEMLSSDELRIQGSTILRYRAPTLMAEELREADDDDFEPLGEGRAVAYRLWRRHPRFSMLADSTMQGVLDPCEELVILTQAVRARARSRLAGAGLLLISEKLSGAPPAEPTADEDPREDVFLSDLTEAMTAPIANEGSASAVVPLVIRVPELEAGMKVADMVAHIQIIDPTQLYPETGLRTECIHRIALGLDMPAEILEGVGEVNHWCVDDQTEVLTRDRGWVGQEDLGVGDVVRTLDQETGLAEWQPVGDVYRASVENEPMLHVESRTHSSVTTLNHRWPVLRTRPGKTPARRWTVSEDLTAADRILTGAPPADLPDEAVYPDDLVEVVAWFVTEGNISGSGGRITIAQSHTANPERVARIRGCLERLYGAPVDRLNGSGYPEWGEATQENLSSFGGPITVFRLNRHAAAPVLTAAPDKVALREFVLSLTRSQLELFVDVSVQADGHHYRSGYVDLWQRNPAALDAFELAAILLGRAVSRQPSHDGGTTVRVLRRAQVAPIKAAEQAARGGGGTATAEVAPYTGVVWCPVTPNGSWLARRDGRTFYTGNSGWLIDEQSWKAHLQPVAQQLVDDLTAAYYRPSLRDAGVEDWQRRSIGYDASEVINHPDRTRDAKDLHDRMVIGDEALRDAAGFNEDDAPSREELNRMIGVALRDGSLAVFGVPSLRSGSELEPQRDVIEAPAAGGGVEGDPSAPGSGGAPGSPPPRPAGAPPVRETPGGGGEEVTKGPPSAQRAAVVAARIVGACDVAVLRAREAAGNRLRSYAKRDPDARDAIAGVRSGQVAAVLGPDRCREVKAPAALELVAGTRDLILDALRQFGIDEPDVAEMMCRAIEQHAARTLFDERPSPIPTQLEHYVAALALTATSTSQAVNGRGEPVAVRR